MWCGVGVLCVYCVLLVLVLVLVLVYFMLCCVVLCGWVGVFCVCVVCSRKWSGGGLGGGVLSQKQHVPQTCESCKASSSSAIFACRSRLEASGTPCKQTHKQKMSNTHTHTQAHQNCGQTVSMNKSMCIRAIGRWPAQLCSAAPPVPSRGSQPSAPRPARVFLACIQQ